MKHLHARLPLTLQAFSILGKNWSSLSHILIFTNSSHLTATKSETRDSSYILDPLSHLWHLCGIYLKSLPHEKNTPSLHPPAANWVLRRYGRISILPSIVTTLIQTFLIVHQSCYNIFPDSMTTHFTFIQFMLHATALRGLLKTQIVVLFPDEYLPVYPCCCLEKRVQGSTHLPLLSFLQLQTILSTVPKPSCQNYFQVIALYFPFLVLSLEHPVCLCSSNRNLYMVWFSLSVTSLSIPSHFLYALCLSYTLHTFQS